jgi:DNA adenine methylase
MTLQLAASAPARPALRYFGGKWKIASWIVSHLPLHDCYVEPFAGGASVLLNKQVSPVEVVNDLDGAVINFFQVLRSRPADLIRAIELTPYARSEYVASLAPSDDPLEWARRVYVWSHQSLGGYRKLPGGWRFQRSVAARGSTPVDDWSNLNHLWAVAWRLKQVFIECDEATSVITRWDSPATLFYVDPPYVFGSRTDTEHGGYVHELTDDQHRALADLLHSVKGMVIISGYPCALYDDLYGTWRRWTHHAVTIRHGRATECLWLNPSADSARPQLFGWME